jgi:hypothetical protein
MVLFLSLTFFSMSRVVTLRLEILSIHQLAEESLGIAWARFTNSLASRPDIGSQNLFFYNILEWVSMTSQPNFWILHLEDRSLI